MLGKVTLWTGNMVKTSPIFQRELNKLFLPRLNTAEMFSEIKTKVNGNLRLVS